MDTLAMDTSKNGQRTRGKPFQAGNKLGKGRPQGSRNKATILLQKLMDSEGEDITRSVIEQALGGNDCAMRLCMERLLPPRKDRAIKLKLPSILTAAGVDEAMNAILQGVAKGEVTPAEAGSLAGLLESRRKSIETAELIARIEAVEYCSSGKGGHEH